MDLEDAERKPGYAGLLWGRSPWLLTVRLNLLAATESSGGVFGSLSFPLVLNRLRLEFY